MHVRRHTRNIKNGRSVVRKHKRGRDKWPPVKASGTMQYLIKYRERIVKEVQGLRNGTRTVLPGHASHPAFMYRRLKQVNSIISKRSNNG